MARHCAKLDQDVLTCRVIKICGVGGGEALATRCSAVSLLPEPRMATVSILFGMAEGRSGNEKSINPDDMCIYHIVRRQIYMYALRFFMSI